MPLFGRTRTGAPPASNEAPVSRRSSAPTGASSGAPTASGGRGGRSGSRANGRPSVPVPPAGEDEILAVTRGMQHLQADLIAPLNDVLNNEPSEDMVPWLDTLVGEAQMQVEQLQQQADICMTRERFDVMQQIVECASDFEELRLRATTWKEEAERRGSASMASPGVQLSLGTGSVRSQGSASDSFGAQPSTAAMQSMRSPADADPFGAQPSPAASQASVRQAQPSPAAMQSGRSQASAFGADPFGAPPSSSAAMQSAQTQPASDLFGAQPSPAAVQSGRSQASAFGAADPFGAQPSPAASQASVRQAQPSPATVHSAFGAEDPFGAQPSSSAVQSFAFADADPFGARQVSPASQPSVRFADDGPSAAQQSPAGLQQTFGSQASPATGQTMPGASDTWPSPAKAAPSTPSGWAVPTQSLSWPFAWPGSSPEEQTPAASLSAPSVASASPSGPPTLPPIIKSTSKSSPASQRIRTEQESAKKELQRTLQHASEDPHLLSSALHEAKMIGLQEVEPELVQQAEAALQKAHQSSLQSEAFQALQQAARKVSADLRDLAVDEEAAGSLREDAAQLQQALQEAKDLQLSDSTQEAEILLQKARTEEARTSKRSEPQASASPQAAVIEVPRAAEVEPVLILKPEPQLGEKPTVQADSFMQEKVRKLLQTLMAGGSNGEQLRKAAEVAAAIGLDLESQNARQAAETRSRAHDEAVAALGSGDLHRIRQAKAMVELAGGPSADLRQLAHILQMQVPGSSGSVPGSRRILRAEEKEAFREREEHLVQQLRHARERQLEEFRAQLPTSGEVQRVPASKTALQPSEKLQEEAPAEAHGEAERRGHWTNPAGMDPAEAFNPFGLPTDYRTLLANAQHRTKWSPRQFEDPKYWHPRGQAPVSDVMHF
ncbi:unnamed protein product [Effrenium voratum]|nr:unnamed protein product [Effrenium voratum]CAJ1368694.1 unnamed protein product [Effrenium voratum]